MKRIVRLGLVLAGSAPLLFGSIPHKRPVDYLQSYLNGGADAKPLFVCTRQSPERYRCRAENYTQRSESDDLKIGKTRLFFDVKVLDPILKGGVAAAYEKELETDEKIERQLDAMPIRDGLQRAMERKRLEKRYLYDSSVRKEVSRKLFEGLEEAVVEKFAYTDLKSGDSIRVERLHYKNGWKRSDGRFLFPFRILGDLSIDFQGLSAPDSTNRPQKKGIEEISALLKSITPPGVKPIGAETIDYINRSTKSLLPGSERLSDGEIVVTNRAIDAGSLESTLRSHTDDPLYGKTHTTMQLRLFNVRGLLGDPAAASQSPDLAFDSLEGSLRLKSGYSQKYRALLARDAKLRASVAEVKRYIHEVRAYYEKASQSQGLHRFLDSFERTVDGWLEGRTDTLSLQIRNRDGSPFSRIFGEVMAAMMNAKGKESFPGSRLVELFFDHFSVEVGSKW
ncbi:hypothetical protein [Hydrogenimonas sp.]